MTTLTASPALLDSRHQLVPAAPVRVLFTVGVVAVAYHRSLSGLVSYLAYDTPVAYVGIVPVLVLLLCLVRSSPRVGELRLPHRHVDWLVGLPLVAVAGIIAFGLPAVLSYHVWTKRLDLIGLPFFVGGVISLVYGARMLHRVRVPVALLVFALPYPYEGVLRFVVDLASTFTVAGVSLLAPVLPGVRATGHAMFAVHDGTREFLFNVGPVCAGASSMLGFALVGAGIMTVLEGRRRAKTAWLGTGILLSLCMNVVRIVVIFASGAAFGQEAALRWFHPYLGLAVFAAGLVVMLCLLPTFGLRLPARAEAPLARRGAARSALTGAVVVVVAAALMSTANRGLRAFEPFAGVSRAGTVASLVSDPIKLDGWAGHAYDEITWTKQYFGPRSQWVRFAYAPMAASDATSVWMDVVETPDLDSFSKYGLESCYRFHGDKVVSSRWLDVGGPARAQTMIFFSARTLTYWSAVSWVWPVEGPAGKRFERVVLLAGDRSTRVTDARARPQVEPRHRSLASSEQAQEDLLAFARIVIAERRGSSGHFS